MGRRCLFGSSVEFVWHIRIDGCPDNQSFRFHAIPFVCGHMQRLAQQVLKYRVTTRQTRQSYSSLVEATWSQRKEKLAYVVGGRLWVAALSPKADL